jgi:uncharacterized membrane protein
MNIATTIPLGVTGWWILMPVMMLLCMGAMMLMMRGMGRGSSRGSPARREERRTESPLDTLERRFAEGEISIEEYRARREALADGGVKPDSDHVDEPLTTGRGGGR